MGHKDHFHITMGSWRSAACYSCKAKTSKSPRVAEILVLCAARNSAGNNNQSEVLNELKNAVQTKATVISNSTLDSVDIEPYITLNNAEKCSKKVRHLSIQFEWLDMPTCNVEPFLEYHSEFWLTAFLPHPAVIA